MHRIVGHDGAVTSVCFAGGGAYLVSSSWDGSTRIWDPDRGRELLYSNSGAPTLQVDTSGWRVGVLREYGSLWVARILPSTIYRHIPIEAESAHCVAFETRNNVLAVATKFGTALYELGSTKRIGVVPSST